MKLKITKVTSQFEFTEKLSVQGIDDLQKFIKVNLTKTFENPDYAGIVFSFCDGFEIMALKMGENFKVSIWRNKAMINCSAEESVISALSYIFLNTLEYECV